ncbi:MAG: hypothetical protein GWN93_27000 [Deltaproteobacteria bacterium]|nr:hypothetical protein [Deltaproteobacteria bacterium]
MASARGWKTYLGAIGAMLTGIGMIAKVVVESPFNPVEVLDGLLVFTGGLTVLGVGHKLQKLIEAIKK